MSAQARRIAIEQRLMEVGEVHYSALADEFSVSEMTIRRDFEFLETLGVLRRVVGGAISLTGTATEPSFHARASRAASGKAHIAAAAVELLHPRETVILDSGSTVLALARAIKGRGLGLTVLTPSVLVALELVGESDTDVILTGGNLRDGELSLVGPDAEQAIARYNCDVYVMGIAGVDAKRGVSDYHREEGSVKRSAIRSANRLIVLADETKLGRVQLVNVAPLSAIDALITDGNPDQPDLVAARNAGVQVICVPGKGEAHYPSADGGSAVPATS